MMPGMAHALQRLTLELLLPVWRDVGAAEVEIGGTTPSV
jgi:hypothetical protein